MQHAKEMCQGAMWVYVGVGVLTLAVPLQRLFLIESHQVLLDRTTLAAKTAPKIR